MKGPTDISCVVNYIVKQQINHFRKVSSILRLIHLSIDLYITMAIPLTIYN